LPRNPGDGFHNRRKSITHALSSNILYRKSKTSTEYVQPINFQSIIIQIVAMYKKFFAVKDLNPLKGLLNFPMILFLKTAEFDFKC
jgi:hypothetical protein